MTQARSPAPTVAFVDDYCSQYRELFDDMREYEQFTLVHVGLLAETKRQSLPRLAKTVQADAQAAHHFQSKARWSTAALRARRLQLLRQALGETPVILCIGETGDRKKGHTTDHVAPSVHWQSAHTGQWDRLGQRLRCAPRRDLSPLVWIRQRVTE
jgi:SRSO17 transposase